MTNKTYNKAQLIYLSLDDDKEAREAQHKMGISLAGFWRMILRDWLQRNRENKK